MEEKLLAYGLSKEIVSTTMVCSPDGGIDFFNIVGGVLQGDILAPYLLIHCLDYILQGPIDLLKEIGFTLKNARSRRYPAETMTNTNYTNDQELLVNTP